MKHATNLFWPSILVLLTALVALSRAPGRMAWSPGWRPCPGEPPFIIPDVSTYVPWGLVAWWHSLDAIRRPLMPVAFVAGAPGSPEAMKTRHMVQRTG